MGLSQLQSALQNNPNLFPTYSHTEEELKTCFEMGIWGIATIFSLLDDEVTKLNDNSSMANRARYVWIENLLNERAQQIRDQRSSLTFLLHCVQVYVLFVTFVSALELFAPCIRD
jgi:hypothetical protein